MYFEVKIKFTRKEEKELSELAMQYKHRLVTATELCNKVAVVTKGGHVQSFNDDGSFVVVVLTDFPSDEMPGCNLQATATIHSIATPE